MHCILCTKEIEKQDLLIFKDEPYHGECLEDYNKALDELKSIYDEFEEDSK